MGFNFDRPYNEKCDLCEHEKDKHWTVNINTGGLMNGPCKNGDEDNPCICDYFESKKEVKTPQQTRSEEILRMAMEQEFGMGSDGMCISCDHVQGGCEADARQYTCEASGEDKVYGATELVLMGY